MISKVDFLQNVISKASFRHRYFSRLFYILFMLKPKKKFHMCGKDVHNFCYLTICNRRSFVMTKASIYSFLLNSPHLPQKIIIVSDGSWKKEEGKRYFKSLDRIVDFVYEDWTECRDFYKEKDINLSIWSEKQIWGKKMSAILKYAEQGLVLYSDSDVLWYGSPIKEEDFKSDFILKLSIDNSHNYDCNLLTKLDVEYLYDARPINCGVVLIKGDLYTKSSILRKAIRLESLFPGNFSEQTIFALLVNELGETWSEETITATIDDILQPVFQVNRYSRILVARHYLFLLKWIYWKDLLFNF